MGCSQDRVTLKSYNEGINIIPAPQQMLQKKGFFHLKGNTVIGFSSREGKSVAEFFASRMNQSTGFKIKTKGEGGDISFNLQPEMNINPEGYELRVMPRSVSIKAKTAAGLFYGMETFMQLLPAEIESSTEIKGVKWDAPCVEIKDEPRFAYRGTMLDVSRHFFTVKELKEQIDVLSMFKINHLHLHLTDDQGWRIEIKKYPKLTEIGSKRTLADGTEYGGFYTQEELKGIVAYAAKRFVTIVPEFELPGHEMAAIASYPNLACDSRIKALKNENKTIHTRDEWGVEDIVMCPGKEDMFTFINEVIYEMVQIFPGTYFHVGGDECPKTSWENCPMCQKRIKDEGIKGDKDHTAEQKLQGYVLQRVEKELNKYGKKLIGWDEILEGGLSPSATVMSWRGESGGIAAALQDHDVIMTPASGGMYLDHYQGDSKIEPTAIGGYFILNSTYAYDPVPDTLKILHKEHFIKGVQCNLWAEFIANKAIQDYRLYPRALALAEVAWTNPEKKDFKDFCRRVENACVRLDGHNVNYHIPLPEQPKGSCNFVAFTDSVNVTFRTTRPMKMVYTTDGTEPTVESAQYTEPIEFKQDATIKICSVMLSGKKSSVRTITVHKEKFSPAVEVRNKHQGLKMKIFPGHYRNAENLKGKKSEKEKVIKALNEIPRQVSRNMNYYAAVASGYIEIPDDGVYYFSSNNEEIWIDGECQINNRGEIKRFPRHDKSMALAKGLHPIKIVFLADMIDGNSSLWDDSHIDIRESTENKFHSVLSENLFY